MRYNRQNRTGAPLEVGGEEGDGAAWGGWGKEGATWGLGRSAGGGGKGGGWGGGRYFKVAFSGCPV
jgi:hypothetical protein